MRRRIVDLPIDQWTPEDAFIRVQQVAPVAHQLPDDVSKGVLVSERLGQRKVSIHSRQVAHETDALLLALARQCGDCLRGDIVLRLLLDDGQQESRVDVAERLVLAWEARVCVELFHLLFRPLRPAGFTTSQERVDFVVGLVVEGGVDDIRALAGPGATQWQARQPT